MLTSDGCSPLLFTTGHSEKHHGRSAKPQHVFIAQESNSGSQSRARNSCDLVNHQAACFIESVGSGGVDAQANQWSVRWIGGKSADRYRIGRVKPIVLDDDDWPGLPCVRRPARDRPDLATFQVPSSVMASMKA